MNEQSIVAYHEAGHALLAEQLGGHVLSVTITPQWDEGPRRHGETKIAWSLRNVEPSEQARREIQVALAGPVAEMVYRDEQYEPELIQAWWADWLVAAKNVRQISPNWSDSRVMAFLAQRVQQLIVVVSADPVWDRIAEIADQLAAHETLEADQLEELRQARIL